MHCLGKTDNKRRTLSLMDIEEKARKYMNKSAWEYLSSAANLQQTMYENSKAFKKLVAKYAQGRSSLTLLLF